VINTTIQCDSTTQFIVYQYIITVLNYIFVVTAFHFYFRENEGMLQK